MFGQAIVSLNDTQVSVDFEFQHNPQTFNLKKTTPITSNVTYLQDLQGFAEFIIVEASVVETNLETRA